MNATRFTLSHVGLSGRSKIYSFIYPFLCLGSLWTLLSNCTKTQQEHQQNGHRRLSHWRYYIHCPLHQGKEQIKGCCFSTATVHILFALSVTTQYRSIEQFKTKGCFSPSQVFVKIKETQESSVFSLRTFKLSMITFQLRFFRSLIHSSSCHPRPNTTQLCIQKRAPKTLQRMSKITRFAVAAT